MDTYGPCDVADDSENGRPSITVPWDKDHPGTQLRKPPRGADCSGDFSSMSMDGIERNNLLAQDSRPSFNADLPILIEEDADFADYDDFDEDCDKNQLTLRKSYRQAMFEIRKNGGYRVNSQINCSVGDFFDLDDDSLNALQDTNFTDLRHLISKQAQLYNELIAPFGKALLKDSEAFFREAQQEYTGDIEAMKY